MNLSLIIIIILIFSTLLFVYLYIHSKKNNNNSLSQNLIDYLPIPLFYKDNHGHYIGCNKAFENVIGMSKEQIVGKTVFDIIPDKIKAKLYHDKEQELRVTNSSIVTEQPFIFADGTKHEILFHISPFKDGIIASMLDITERKRLQQSFQDSEELYRNILSKLPDVVMLHKQGIIHYLNDAATIYTGYELHEFVGHNIIEFISVSDREKVMKSFSVRENSDEKIEEYEIDIITKNGSTIRGLIKSDTVKYKDEIFSLAVIVNVTGVKKLQIEKDDMQKKMYQSSKLASIGTLAAGIVHEINNPMMILRGYVELVGSRFKEQNITDPQLLESISKQESAIQRISEIIYGLKTFARMDNDTLEEIDINKVIYDVLSIIEYIIVKESIIIKRETRAENTIIKGNMGRLQQVLVNLLTNAKDALENIDNRQKTITISTENVDNHIHLSVTDNGCGISKDHMERIFDAFYTTKTSGKGTGLGLAISYSIIKAMEGNIEVKSIPNEGTTFTVILPNTTQLIAETEKEDELKFEKIPSKFLIVDDEQSIRDILKIFLTQFGAKLVVEAENGAIALQKINENVFDYIITDIKMPVMSGDKLILELFEKGIKSKLIAITGGIVAEYSDEQREIINNNAFGYLKKPFTKVELYKVIKGIISHN